MATTFETDLTKKEFINFIKSSRCHLHRLVHYKYASRILCEHFRHIDIVDAVEHVKFGDVFSCYYFDSLLHTCVFRYFLVDAYGWLEISEHLFDIYTSIARS